MRNVARKIYITLIFIFLYAPIVTLMFLSFNASKSRAKWGGFTLKWYKQLFRMLKSFRLSGTLSPLRCSLP